MHTNNWIIPINLCKYFCLWKKYKTRNSYYQICKKIEKGQILEEILGKNIWQKVLKQNFEEKLENIRIE